MGDEVLLCHVNQYNNNNYIKQIPFPTGTDDDISVSTPHTPKCSQRFRYYQEDRFLHALQRMKQAIAHQLEGGSNAMSDKNSDRYINTHTALHQEKELHERILDNLDIDDGVHIPAVNQHLVDEFFLDGSKELNGRTISGYPIYGSRNTEDRLSAVCKALKNMEGPWDLETHFPSTWNNPLQDKNLNTEGGDCIESKEQYWRRVARHYIYKKNNSHNPECSSYSEKSLGNTFGASSSHIQGMDTPGSDGEDEPFYMIDMGCVVEQMAIWRHHLPMVRPFFAIKCNPDIEIARLLAAMGSGFDCASKAEIALVMDRQLINSSDDIVFANPCKQLADLKEANARGVTYVTCDNVAELSKIAKYMPQAQVLLRIRTNDQAAQCSFSRKFGAPLHDIRGLLDAARSLNVDIYGVAFHVGSGNSDASAYISAIRDAHQVFQLALAYGFNCTLLDIGGGFPGVDPTLQEQKEGKLSFESIAAAIKPLLIELFPDTKIISEPGRFFTASSHTLAMNVYAMRTLRLSEEEKFYYTRTLHYSVIQDEEVEYQYYVNDGVYDSFNCILFDHAHPRIVLLDDGDGADNCVDGNEKDSLAELISDDDVKITNIRSPFLRRRLCPRRCLRLVTIFGPTCDSLDCIMSRQPFPEMHLGDWLLALDMGSYTTAAGCSFNGFKTRKRYYINSVAISGLNEGKW